MTRKDPKTLGAVKGSERLESLRRQALERFDALPWPTSTDEEWRRTDPEPFCLKNPTLGENPAALDVQVETLSPELIQAGVVLTSLSDAFKRFPDLVEKYLFQSGTPESLLKFTSLHQAYWTDGLFCHIPEGVSVEVPLKAKVTVTQGDSHFSNGAAATFPHTVVVVEQGAQLTLIDQRRGQKDSGKTFTNEMVEIFVKKGASLQYVHLQHWPEQTLELFTQRAVLEREAQFLNVTVGLGSQVVKANVETIVTEPGAHADLLGLFFEHRDQHFDFHTLQDHKAPHCSTDLFYESALRDTAQAVYTGLIRIRKEAQKSDAYQHNRNLILSQGAKADSIPMLEIEADDVRCTHGVAVGPVDEEQLYYLMSRGIPQKEAQQLVVEGFFDQVLRRIPLESVREQLLSEVVERLRE